MFERTVLPDGPRVISARIPGSRSVSIAAYVLAGSRLEAPEQAGVFHMMQHIPRTTLSPYPTLVHVGSDADSATPPASFLRRFLIRAAREVSSPGGLPAAVIASASSPCAIPDTS